MLLWVIFGIISLVQCLKPSELFRWPAGTYGIPKPKSGCPKTDDFQWLEGWRSQGSDSRNLNNSGSAEFHLDGTVDNTKVNRSFCIKDYITHDSVRPTWPKGQYCIYKKRKCPAGLTNNGAVYWDDENTLNTNAIGGMLPGGKYKNSNTQIRFCCKRDGDKKDPIVLPSEQPFFLLAYGSDECQMVKWAIATLEWIYYDTEDKNNQDRAVGACPYDAGKKNPVIYYCYYRGCKKSLNGTIGTFHSPNYPEKYPDGQYCSWRITVSPTQKVHLIFTEFSLQNENNTDAVYVYDGENDKGEVLGVFYGGRPPPIRGIYSSSNQIFLIFMSDRNASYTGFNALYCENTCSEPTTAATTYTQTTTQETLQSTLKKSTTSEEPTATKRGGKTEKRKESGEKGVNLVAVVVPVVVLIVLVSLVLAGFLYYKRRRSTEQVKETPNVFYASPQMAHDNLSYDRSTGGPPPSVGNPCYDRGFISITNSGNSGAPEPHELYASLNPNTMDRREAPRQPDDQYQPLYTGAPVYDTLEPGQATSNPIYESTT